MPDSELSPAAEQRVREIVRDEIRKSNAEALKAKEASKGDDAKPQPQSNKAVVPSESKLAATC